MSADTTVAGALPGSSQGAGSSPGCRCCGHPAEELVLSADGFPALCNAFDVDAERARAMPTGRFELLACTRCGSLRNAAFDPDLLPYDDRYENSLHGSGTFGSFATELAADLDSWRPLAGATVVEVGSGQGDFLRVLADHGLRQAYGLDPSLNEPVEITDAASPITLLPGTLDDFTEDLDADLLLSRHVLEHVTHPLELLVQMRERLARPGTAIYVEVPDGTYMVRTPALWDLIHEHVGYFTAAGVRALLQRAGWSVDDVGRSFGDQYL
jgi:2-polyprenyl-3-methyl-5-hydroxy-6-metoxy-1,4-benzoquinol methylase